MLKISVAAANANGNSIQVTHRVCVLKQVIAECVWKIELTLAPYPTLLSLRLCDWERFRLTGKTPSPSLSLSLSLSIFICSLRVCHRAQPCAWNTSAKQLLHKCAHTCNTGMCCINAAIHRNTKLQKINFSSFFYPFVIQRYLLTYLVP